MSDAAPTTACPDAASLRALLDGTLPEDQQAATQAHVDQCRVCEAALRQMTAGGESWIGMAQKLRGENVDDPKLTAAMERLKTDDGSDSESHEPADPQRTLDFLEPTDDPKLLGKLGQHEISEVVGWGGMGVVLKAYDPSLHRVVAVKVLASHLAHHAVARKRFIREAQAAAAVCHDNVVTIHAIEESGPQPKIVMQFVAGGSLQERIDQEGPLELKEILRIALQTAAGLAAAHAQGVVHRDVKPANILLENGVQRVKLTDFGLARVMDDASLTLSGVIAGTPQYMAPEQAWGRDVDARADLFSLGVVMYAMCSGHSPFRARTTMAVLKRVCEDAPRPLRAINPDVPDWLVAIIEKLLAKNPDERFQTATEVSELLSRWLAHVQQPNVAERPEPIIARRGSPDPAASSDRRSPEFGRGANSEGDRRSNPSAGSGDPRTAWGAARGPSAVTLTRAWIPLLVMCVVMALVVIEQLHLAAGIRNPARLETRDVIESFGIAVAHIFAAALSYGVFFVGWNTLGGRQRLAMCIILGSLTWSYVGAVQHLRTEYAVPFWPQIILSGIYLLAIAARHVSQHGEEMLNLPGEGKRGSPPSPVGTADPTAHRADVFLPLGWKHAFWPVLVIGVLMAMGMTQVDGRGTNNLTSFLGFAAANLAVAFVIGSTFRAAWNTASWLVWFGAVLLLMVLGQGFVYGGSSQQAPELAKLTFGLQGVMSLAALFGLFFVRPLLARSSGRWMTERLTGWQRIAAVACFTMFGVPLTFIAVWWLSWESSGPMTEVGPKSIPVIRPSDRPRTMSTHRDPQFDERGFPKPQLLAGAARIGAGSSGDMSAGGGTASAAAISENLKPLLGRWVVVSSEGAALGSAAMMGGASGTPIGPATSSGMTGGGASPAMGGFGASATSPPLQWIEFANDRVVIFDGRETTMIADGSELTDPKRLFLVTRDEQTSASSFWRSGIYRLERDRLIVCWTTSNHPLPTEFSTENHPAAQLLVLRREWNPSPDLSLFSESSPPPPRAVIPFTANEAKRYQEAWARSANVPVEITNSLGMKLRLIPPGAFDPLQQQMLASVYRSQYLEVAAVLDPHVPSRPLYLATQEVTLGQFRKFVEATKYVTSAERTSQPQTWRSPGIAQDSEEHPVVRVSWNDALAFCKWLSETEHESYRLPLFAEWAFAARAGLAAELRMKSPVNARLKFFDTTAPVGGDTANLFGLHDVFGNVSEWTFDVSVQPGEFDDLNKDKRAEDKRRVFNLGGGFRSALSEWQTATGGRPIQHAKAWLFPREADDSSTFDDVGFRVVREIAKEAKASDKVDEPSAKPQP